MSSLSATDKFLGTSNVTVQVTVSDPEYVDNTYHTTALSTAFDEMGVPPTGTMRNLTHTFNVDFKKASDVCTHLHLS
jgi:hypothetical protein